jgi:DNA-binding transcriptional MerR regulator
MKKAEGAFLTISELAGELGLPQHILRYWETRFPQLRPLQRSGNRRYYRPDDVVLARRIHHLLHVEGFTVKGAQKALSDGDGMAAPKAAASTSTDDLVARLQGIRAALAAALKV